MLKRFTGPGKSFHSLSTAKATLTAVVAFRFIKHRHLSEPLLKAAGEISLVNGFFTLSN
ncbi:MAG: hypothetical protein AB8B87_26860 [Granulosicoccus sp.]